MNNNTRMITRSSLKADYDYLSTVTPTLEPKETAKLAVRLAFLTPSERTDLNLAAHYCLKGEFAVVLAVLPPVHPMADIFSGRGEAKDKRVIEYVRNHLHKQDIQSEISRLEAMSI